MLDHPTLAMFREFLIVPAPPGREERFADLVRQKLMGLNLDHETDGMGNVRVRLKGRRPDGPLVVYAAHMDEIGMVVTRVQPDGSLGVDKSGGLYTWKIGERPVDVLGDHAIVPGVLSFGSIHSRRIQAQPPPDWPQARIITGLSPEALDRAGVRVGSSAVPQAETRGPVVLGEGDDPLIGAWTFDDKIDVVNLILLLQEFGERKTQPLLPSVVAFTVQEENGCHGARFLARDLQPDLFVALDGCPVLPDLDLALDGRPGIWSRDAVAHFDQEVLQFFSQCAKEVGTDLAAGVFDGAASDASVAFSTGSVPRAATVGHIRDNSHGFEVARLSSIENVRKVVARFMETWGG